MEQIIKFSEGGEILIEKERVTIFSKTGEKEVFDLTGKRVAVFEKQDFKEETANIPYWNKFFFKIGKSEQEQVKKWYLKKIGKTAAQVEFLERLGIALKNINYSYRIATIEPTINESEEIFYTRGAKVVCDLSPENWVVKAKEFSSEYNSRLATLDELLVWYAYRIIVRRWTIEDVCDKNVERGRYVIKLSGEEKYHGERDGIGNTAKLVKDGDDFALVGPDYNTVGLTTVDVRYFSIDDIAHSIFTGVIVLQK